MKMPEWWRVRPGKRTLAALLVLILLAMAIYGGWRASGAADVGPAGQTWQVHREDVDQQLALVGVVESARVIQLTAPFDGVVTEKRFQHNQLVKAGDALLHIDASELAQQRAEAEIAYLKAQEQRRLFDHLDNVPDISRARRNLALAQAAWSNARKKAQETALLFDKGIVSRNERDDSEEQARQQAALAQSATEELASAQERFNAVQKQVAEVNLAAAQHKYQALLHAEQNNPLTAPISGVALVSQPAQSGQTPVERGSRVTRGQPLLNLIDPANLVVAFKVDEMLVRRLQAGQEVQFYSDVLGQSLRGSVSFIAAQASPVLSAAKSAEFEVRAELAHAQTRQQAALIGSTGKLSLVLPLWRHAIAIPVAFLQDSAQGPQVYVRLPDGQVRPRSVQVGETQDGKVEIRAGLAEGEMLMTPPL